jgi:hypothetical protein
VCRAVDPEGEPAGYDQSASGETFGEIMSGIAALGSGITAADDRQLRIVQNAQVADHVQRRRMTFRPAQQDGIAGVGERHDMMAGIFQPRPFGAAARLDKNWRAAADIPARSRDASEACVMPCAEPKISSALERMGMSSAGARVSVAQAEDSSLVCIGRIIEHALRQRR